MSDRKMQAESAPPIDVEELSVVQSLGRLKIKSVRALVGWCVAIMASCFAAGIAVARFIDSREAAGTKAQLEHLQAEQVTLSSQNAELRRDIGSLNGLLKAPTPDIAIHAPAAASSTAGVTLASFTINEQASYYERTNDFDPLVASRIMSWQLSAQGAAIIAAFRNRQMYTTNRWVSAFVEGAVADGTDPARAKDIARIFTGSNAAAQEAEVSRASPILDATVLNRSESVAVLTHVQIEFLAVEFAEEGGEEEPPPELPRPLQVVGRYLLPVEKIYQRQYERSEWPRIELLPPIQIPRQQAARIQLQLHIGYIYLRYVRFRLRLIANGGEEITTPVVSLFVRRD